MRNTSAETDRAWDRALSIRTSGQEYVTSAKYMPYEPTPYQVLERLAGSGLISSSDHVLDYGCGKGRAAFFLAARTGCRVTGIDRSEKLISIANEYLEAFARPDLVRFLLADAEKYSPETENVFYFFNPFSEAVLDVVLRRLMPRFMACPHARMLFYYPGEPFLARLAREPGLRLAWEIDCRDLFGDSDPREKIAVYDHP